MYCQKKRTFRLTTCDPCRCGYTLVELMVVITIILLVATAVAASVLQGADETKMREAARELTAFLTKVRAKAVSEREAYGIMFIREMDTTGTNRVADYATKVAMIKSSGSFKGDTPSSRVLLCLSPPTEYLDAFPDANQYYKDNYGDHLVQWHYVYGIGVVDSTQQSQTGVSSGSMGVIVRPDIGYLGQIKFNTRLIVGGQSGYFLPTDPENQIDPNTGVFITPPTEESPYIFANSTTNLERMLDSNPPEQWPQYFHHGHVSSSKLRSFVNPPSTGFEYSYDLPPTVIGSETIELPPGVCVDFAGSPPFVYHAKAPIEKLWEYYEEDERLPTYLEIAEMEDEDFLYQKTNPYAIFSPNGNLHYFTYYSANPWNQTGPSDNIVDDAERDFQATQMQWLGSDLANSTKYGYHNTNMRYTYHGTRDDHELYQAAIGQVEEALLGEYFPAIMLGKIENTSVPRNDLVSPRNWHDPSSVFISFHHVSGKILSAPVVAQELDPSRSPLLELLDSMSAITEERFFDGGGE